MSNRTFAFAVKAWRKSTELVVVPDDGTRVKEAVSRDEIADLFRRELYGHAAALSLRPTTETRTTPQARQAPSVDQTRIPDIEQPNMADVARRNRMIALMARNLKRIIHAADPVPKDEPLLLVPERRFGIANVNAAPQLLEPQAYKKRRLHLTMGV